MHIHMWPYKAIYIGISPDNDVHAHHAVQICNQVLIAQPSS